MIREFSKKDTAAVMQVWIETIVVAHDFVNSNYWHDALESMKNNYILNSDSYVYLKDGGIVGFISIIEGNTIGAIFVEKPFQGKGIGEALIDYVKNKYEKLYISVFEKNKSDKFDRLESEREDIIHKIIEHSDGLNHVRAAKLIQRVFIQNSKRELKYIGVWLKRTCLNCFRKASYFTVLDKIPIIRRYHRYLKKLEGMYDYEERKIISMRYKSAQIKFYNENQINLKKLVDEFK